MHPASSRSRLGNALNPLGLARLQPVFITGSLDHPEEFHENANVSVEVGRSARIINLRWGEVVLGILLELNALGDLAMIFAGAKYGASIFLALNTLH